MPGNQSKTPPKGEPFCTVTLITERDDGTAWVRPGDAIGSLATWMSHTLKYSVQWFRKGARDNARSFRSWARGPYGINMATDYGFTFIGTSEIRQIDEIVSSRWEERAGLDLSVGIESCDDRSGGGQVSNIDIEIVPETDITGLSSRTVRVETSGS